MYIHFHTNSHALLFRQTKKQKFQCVNIRCHFPLHLKALQRLDPSLQRSFLSELSSTYRRIHSSQGSLFLVFSSFCFSFYEESVYSLYLPVHQVKSHVTFPGSIFTRFLTNLSFSKIFRTGLVLLENHQRDSYYSLNLFFLFFHF